MKENSVDNQRNDIVTLEFYITAVNILNMDVNLQKKTTKVTHLSSEPAVWPILAKDKRHYAGLERRLQLFMQSKRALPDLIDEIEENGIHVDFHDNLWIRVKRQLEDIN